MADSQGFWRAYSPNWLAEDLYDGAQAPLVNRRRGRSRSTRTGQHPESEDQPSDAAENVIESRELGGTETLVEADVRAEALAAIEVLLADAQHGGMESTEPFNHDAAAKLPVCDEPAHVEPVRVEPVRVEPAYAKPAHVEPVHVEPVHVEPVHVEPVHVEPVHVEPVHVEPVHDKPVCDEPAHVEPAHAKPVHAKPVALKTKCQDQSRPHGARQSDRRQYRPRATGWMNTGSAGRSTSRSSRRTWVLIGVGCAVVGSLFLFWGQPLSGLRMGSEADALVGYPPGMEALQGDRTELLAAPQVEIASMIVENEVPANFLFRPVIETSGGKTSGGLVFAAYQRDPEHPLFLGNLSRLGPAGGLNEQIDALDLFTSWRSIRLFDPLTHRARGVCTSRPKIIPGARPFPENSLHGDVFAVGDLPTKRLNALPLSAEKPSMDDPVWVILPVQDVGLRVVPCRVSGFDQNWMSFVFEDAASQELMSGLHGAEVTDEKSQLDIGGAPVVNAAGEVVGVAAVMEREGGHWIGQATLAVYFGDYL